MENKMKVEYSKTLKNKTPKLLVGPNPDVKREVKLYENRNFR